MIAGTIALSGLTGNYALAQSKPIEHPRVEATTSIGHSFLQGNGPSTERGVNYWLNDKFALRVFSESTNMPFTYHPFWEERDLYFNGFNRPYGHSFFSQGFPARLAEVGAGLQLKLSENAGLKLGVEMVDVPQLNGWNSLINPSSLPNYQPGFIGGLDVKVYEKGGTQVYFEPFGSYNREGGWGGGIGFTILCW